MFLNIVANKSKSEEARARLESALQVAWDTIDQEFFDKLWQSIDTRVKACIAANGWHTKY